MEEADDTQAFEAALSFVEEFSFEDAVVGELSSLPPAPPDNAAPQIHEETGPQATRAVRSKAAAKRSLSSSEEKRKRQNEVNERRRLLRKVGVYGDSNRVRNERTREIAFLREQMERLQLDLKVLQTRQVQEQREARRANATALVARNPTSVPGGMWKEQAVRQRRRRQEAERDNVRLRLAVERQQKVATNLKSLMNKRSSQLTNECASLVSSCCAQRNTVDVLDFRGDIGDFRNLFYHLDAAYRDVDSVFAANGLANMETSPIDVHVREGVEGKYLEFSTYKDLPFTMQDAAQACWDHFKGVEKHQGNGNLYQKAAKSLDEPYTIIEDFSKEVYSNNSRADVKLKQVVRRYVEADRDIVIWVSHATPVEVKHKLLRGLAYNFRGYAITRRSPASTEDNELTQLQLCSLISLDQEEGAACGPDNVRALTNFLVVHAAKNILAHRERIENTLADRALRRAETDNLQVSVLLTHQSVRIPPPVMAFLLGDDDEHALEAALSFVEEFKLDDEPSSSAQSSHVQAGGVHSPRKPEDSLAKRARANARKKLLRQAGIYSDPNRARNERTREIAFLREQIEKLQIDLHTLQGRDGSKPLRDCALVSKNCKSQISSMWQDQALRQQRRRGEAERDNVRLRLAVERQRKVASSLQSLMKKRANQLTNECASLMNLCCSGRNTVDVLDFCGDIEDFRELFQRVDDAYRDVDAVFAANGLARSTISPGDVHMREGVDGKYLEFSTYKDMPYEVMAATEVVWDHFKGVEKHLGVGNIYTKAAKNLDEPYTIVEDFSIEIYSNSSRADYKTKQVVRRYVEANRDIVIWVSHATPVEVKHKLLSGLSYNFLGYTITKRSSASTAEQELTQLQLCSRMSLDQEAGTIYSSESARTLVNFLIVHQAKNIVAHRESIENNLADRVLRQRLQ
ncbi:M96 mating-specific protein family [Phytophthora cinnamomi]|uniref:M96 mating-specific protein family n=1 Tax=Phytophthora cinnamomi TaxID=4785 RepID=UPI00355A30BB|nr:M96 mating-specific protein family [Phytophthora cinnamomi]